MSYLPKQVQGRSIGLAKKPLPKSPNKKSELYNFTKPRRKRADISEKEKQRILDTLDRPNLIYASPGCKDHFYIGKQNGFQKYI